MAKHIYFCTLHPLNGQGPILTPGIRDSSYYSYTIMKKTANPLVHYETAIHTIQRLTLDPQAIKHNNHKLMHCCC